jgi:hypothetical protein
MVRSASSRVSNHGVQHALILRDAARRPLLGIRRALYTATGFACREIISVIDAAMMHNTPAAKNAGK